MWNITKMLWPIWVAIGGIIVLQVLVGLAPIEFDRWMEKRKSRKKFRKGENQRDNQRLLAWLQDMEPSEFEEYTADLFNRMGFRARAVGKSHDGGIDVIAKKDGIKHYVQCKRYKGSVSEPAIRDFYGAITGRLAEGKAYFITTGHFTREAEAWAEDKPIELVDGNKLVRWIRKFGVTELSM